MPNEFNIRPAKPADCAAIAVLMTQLHREEGHDVVAQANEISAALFAPAREVQLQALVGEANGEVVAALLYYPGYDTLSASVGYHLADVIVAAKHRRQGIGKALLKALAAQTLDENKEWVSLTALKQNAVAHGFYQSLRMTQVDVDFFAIGKTALSQL